MPHHTVAPSFLLVVVYFAFSFVYSCGILSPKGGADMALLNNKEDEFLKRIYKKPVRADILAKKLRVDEDGLNELILGNLQEYIYVYSSDSKSKFNNVRILPEGKAIVDLHRREARRWAIPLIVSIIAIILATIALIC
jgi:hypothetical protein